MNVLSKLSMLKRSRYIYMQIKHINSFNRWRVRRIGSLNIIVGNSITDLRCLTLSIMCMMQSSGIINKILKNTF